MLKKKEFIMGCDTAKQADMLEEYMEKECPDQNKDILIEKADKGKKMIDVNGEKHKKYVIFSPKMYVACRMFYNPRLPVSNTEKRKFFLTYKNFDCFRNIFF